MIRKSVAGNSPQHRSRKCDVARVKVMEPLHHRSEDENKEADRQVVVLEVGKNFVNIHWEATHRRKLAGTRFSFFSSSFQP